MVRRVSIALVLLLSWCCASLADDQRWLRVSTGHFTVFTDADRNRGHLIAARFEQMRAVFAQLLVRKKLRMSKPIEIFATGSAGEYSQLAPPQAAGVSGFWLEGEDRILIVLNGADPDSWRAIEYDFGRYLLDYNYPPTQPWFDEGFAEYFSSVYFTPAKMRLGGDPGLQASAQGTRLAQGSLAEVLKTQTWMPLANILELKPGKASAGTQNRNALFNAQSWMLVHYLIVQDKLSETGNYFELVENERIPVAQAVQQAFGMPVAQLEQAVKDYFHGLKPLLVPAERSRQPSVPAVPPATEEMPMPFAAEEVAGTIKEIPLQEALALVQEMELRIPDKREEAVKILERLAGDPRTETVIAHRALAWAHVQKGEINEAFQELSAAVQMESSDPWTRLGLALASYHSGEKGARIQGLANMMESLHVVIDQFPEYAEAYNMLGWARLIGGGANAALEAMRMAVQLSPRNQQYQLRLARALLAAKKFDDATATLERLQLSEDPQIAAAAKKDLHDLPFLKKYGVSPADDATPPKPVISAAPRTEAPDNDEDADSASKAEEEKPQIDKRPVKFLKTTILSVDCSKPPMAVVTVSQGAKTLHLRAASYKSLLVIGSDEFSCAWKRTPANVNYRPGGKLDGDLVSIEIRNGP
ncbi:MAG TPA: tetratricopeptide repeat protein [Terriglobales bacterium]|nr:tetratricopeptide repeat protein [Terriglobales bacterium]